ncbi:MAG TPA: spore coat U domain-containing protein [Steroidobacteraceae bacterium]|nr:spore coat U domain-containing protein [Steroidobacteraceae bacterium]
MSTTSRLQPLSALLACAALALGSPAAHAAITSCTVSAIGVAFGTYTPMQATALDMNGTINIACTGVTGRNTVTIDLSTGASNNYLNRTLTAGAATLGYNLYFDAAYTQVWGNGTGGSVVGSATIRRRTPNASLPVYGAIAARQDPAPGSYADTILVSVNY